MALLIVSLDLPNKSASTGSSLNLIGAHPRTSVFAGSDRQSETSVRHQVRVRRQSLRSPAEHPLDGIQQCAALFVALFAQFAKAQIDIFPASTNQTEG